MGRRKLPSVPHQLVLVEWEDSSQPISSWQWADDYQSPEIVRCISVGYLIADTAHSLALAPNVGDVNRERMQVSGIIRIPRRSVVTVRNL
jgi:hypothetical protein